jgi:hypothetical protein
MMSSASKGRGVTAEVALTSCSDGRPTLFHPKIGRELHLINTAGWPCRHLAQHSSLSELRVSAQRRINMAYQPSSDENSPLLNGRVSNTTDEQDTSPHVSGKMNIRLGFKIAAAMYSFITLGLFNSSIGAILPLLSKHYKLTDLQVSSIFLAGPIGYVFAAQCSDTIHHRFGQRGIATAGPVLQIIATVTAAAHPKFEVVLVAFVFQGLGTGLLDGSWCAWAGSMEKANTISGLLHGCYSVGGAMGPFLVTVLTAKGEKWWTWYGILVRSNRNVEESCP